MSNVTFTDFIYTIIRCRQCFTRWAVVPFGDHDNVYFDRDGDMSKGFRVAADGPVCPTCVKDGIDILDGLAVRTSNGQWIPIPEPPPPAFSYDNSGFGVLPPKPTR